jgi:hypothetical protein
MKSLSTCCRFPQPHGDRGIDPTTISAARILRAKDVVL